MRSASAGIQPAPAAGAGRHVVVVGAGGNIGSHLVPHLGRLPGVARVTLIDRGRYEPANRSGQDIEPRHVGRPKASVQAARLRRLAPGLAVEALAADVERLPLGRLRADVILACLDSRRARQAVNEAAWRLGVPWVDAGVAVLEDGELLARLSIYSPSGDGPCLECSWSDRDYDLVEQPLPCEDPSLEPAATGAPSCLGSLAASLQALECRRMLAGEPARAGHQVLVSAAHHTLVTTRFRRNPDCRMPDHAPWPIAPLAWDPGRATLGDALALAGASGDAWLEVAGGSFARRATCLRCGAVRMRLRLVERPGVPRCRRCGARLAVTGFDRLERLSADRLVARDRRRTLASLGLRAGDVLRVGGTGEPAVLEIVPPNSTPNP